LILYLLGVEEKLRGVGAVWNLCQPAAGALE
jgi:hypothetical protein